MVLKGKVILALMFVNHKINNLKTMKTYRSFITEAKRRIKILRTAHYTDRKSKESIMSQGFNRSPSSGAYHSDEHDVIYTTPQSRAGRDYGSHRVSLSIVNPKIHKTDAPQDYGKNLKNWMSNASDDDLVKGKNRPKPAHLASREALSQGAKVVKIPSAGQKRGHDYIMINRELANRSISKNPPPFISKRRK